MSGSTQTIAVEEASPAAPASLERALEERDRRTLFWMAAISIPLFAVGLAALPFIGPWTQLKTALAVTMPAGALAAAWIVSSTRRPGKDTRWVKPTGFVILAFPTALNTINYGIFSPAILILFLFIYVAGLSGTRTGPIVYLVAALCHAICAALFITGTVADPGIVQVRVSGVEAWLGEALTQSALLAGLLLGRVTRRVTSDVLRDLHDANLNAARKDVLAREIAARLREAQGPDRRGALSGLEVGKYRLGNLIGRGGMGEVYRGVDEVDNAAAIKVLSPSVTQSDRSLERFQREVESLRRLDHRNIVRLLDAGTTDEGLPFMAMELLRGSDLSELLRASLTLSPERCVELVQQVCSALDYAWQKSIVHRDLKPQNLFLDSRTDSWKVLDFGVAKLVDAETMTGAYVLGTPAYMSPEQASGREVDRRSDLFAITAIIYRALTGFPAFSGGNAPALIHAVVYEHPQRPSDLADLGLDIDRIVAVGLAKSPDKRFETGEELANAFRAAVGHELGPDLRARGDQQLRRWDAGIDDLSGEQSA
ncbi:MAG: serine/threonine protein kinase [Deltaproteobacteria bacterium]|nr:serine/threonine protein kinase [Deltaproteobacteria bacterium]